MQATETVLSVIRNLSPGNDHWRAHYGETRTAGSGRGRRKRTRTAGTSPAAYFTLRGAGRSNASRLPGDVLVGSPSIYPQPGQYYRGGARSRPERASARSSRRDGLQQPRWDSACGERWSSRPRRGTGPGLVHRGRVTPRRAVSSRAWRRDWPRRGHLTPVRSVPPRY
jgi:hypothetical protein